MNEIKNKAILPNKFAVDPKRYEYPRDFVPFKYAVLTDWNKKPLATGKKLAPLVSNNLAAFDIETTNFTTPDGKLLATMYIWMFCVNGHTITGRYWGHYYDFLQHFNDEVLNEDMSEGVKILPVYVHNLGFEFSFMAAHDECMQLFAIDSHKPAKVRFVRTPFFEYRDSLLISGMPLEAVKLKEFNIKKMAGDLDYDKQRHGATPLTDEEIGYCINDVLMVCGLVYEKLKEQDYNLAKVPMTRTGFVRNIIRKRILSKEKTAALVASLKMTRQDYNELRALFAGGFTHANSCCSCKTYSNIISYDIGSSYPTVMVCEKFPMGGFTHIKPNVGTFKRLLKTHACKFKLRLAGVKERYMMEHYISRDKCVPGTLRGAVLDAKDLLDNGRVAYADYLEIWCTEIDFSIIMRCYNVDRWQIDPDSFSFARKDYLPKEFVDYILELYGEKTEYKNKPGYEIIYALAKERINSLFGICCTDPVRETWVFQGGEWVAKNHVKTARKRAVDRMLGIEDPDEEPDEDYIDKAVKRHNNSRKRFLYYAWGVWVTAYARRNLWTLIFQLGDDYIYADTDSIKFCWDHKYADCINKYNRGIDAKMRAVCAHYDLDYARTRPKGPDGNYYPLGHFEFDAAYARFRTCGAKRYIYEKVEVTDEEQADLEAGRIDAATICTNNPDGSQKARHFDSTVAGLGKWNKHHPERQRLPQYLEKLEQETGVDKFEHFTDLLTVPAEYTGKLMHTFNSGIWEEDYEMTDYLGNTKTVHVAGGMHLGPQAYSLKISESYMRMLFSRGTKLDRVDL